MYHAPAPIYVTCEKHCLVTGAVICPCIHSHAHDGNADLGVSWPEPVLRCIWHAGFSHPAVLEIACNHADRSKFVLMVYLTDACTWC